MSHKFRNTSLLAKESYKLIPLENHYNKGRNIQMSYKSEKILNCRKLSIHCVLKNCIKIAVFWLSSLSKQAILYFCLPLTTKKQKNLCLLAIVL